MNLFYKIHLQAFNVISIVLYHGGPTFGQVNNEGVQTGIQDLPKGWTAVIKHNGDYIEGL
jgi:hypothetical protein